ncbi:hypothetical protein ACSXBA_09210 [Clostridium perfringens]|nr:hypothetical protein [Clostridium perfringens]MDM0643311.1 hypothetical protein [Clostridium perfringens]
MYIILTTTQNLFLSDMDKLCFKLMRTNNDVETFDYFLQNVDVEI